MAMRTGFPIRVFLSVRVEAEDKIKTPVVTNGSSVVGREEVTEEMVVVEEVVNEAEVVGEVRHREVPLL